MDENKDASPKEQQAPVEVPPPAPPTVDPPQPPPNPNPEQDGKPKKMSNSDKIMVWATCVIAAGTLVSAAAIAFQWREMVKGGADTSALVGYAQRQADDADKIKSSADKQAAAAQRFADTAGLINSNVNDAVGKLDAQARATQRSANAAKSAADTAIAGLRPWIKIMDVQTRGEGTVIPALSFQTNPVWPAGTSQTTFQLQISLKNVGHSPARLTVDFELFLPLWKNGYSDVIYQEKRRFCNAAAKKGLKVDPSLQIILFLEESHNWDGGGAALVDSKVINYFSDHGTVPYILPVVAVCTNYQFGDSPTIYQTSALYEVFRKDDRTRFFEVGKGIPASQIFLIRNEASDDAY